VKVKNETQTRKKMPVLLIFSALSALFGSGAIIGLTLFNQPLYTYLGIRGLLPQYLICFAILFLALLGYGSIHASVAYIALPVACLACGARTTYTSFFNPLVVALVFVILTVAAIAACLWALYRDPIETKKSYVWLPTALGITGACVAAVASLWLFVSIFAGRLDSLQTGNTQQAAIGQMLYYVQNSGQPFTTLIAGAPQSYFLTQFAPLWYLLLPVYALSQHSMLAVGIALYVAMLSAILPLWRICRKLSLSPWQASALCIALACAPLLIGGASGGGVLSMLSLPLLLWVADTLMGKHPYLALIPLALCLGIGFEVTLWTAFFCLYLTLSADKQNRRAGWICTVVSAVVLVATIVYLAICQSPVLTGLFANVGLQATQKLTFFMLLLLPSALLPLLSGQKWALLLLVPLALFHLVADASVYSGVFCSFAYPAIAVVFLLCAHGTARLHTEIRGIRVQKLLPTAALCTSILLSAPYASLLSQLYVPEDEQQITDAARMHDLLDKLPQNASVTASDSLLCELHDRTWLFSLSACPEQPQTNVIVLDLREDFVPTGMEEYTVEYYQSLGYTLRTDLGYDGILAVLFK